VAPEGVLRLNGSQAAYPRWARSGVDYARGWPSFTEVGCGAQHTSTGTPILPSSASVAAGRCPRFLVPSAPSSCQAGPPAVLGVNQEAAQTTGQSCLNRFLTEVEWDA
jgi:hypothetical protein